MARSAGKGERPMEEDLDTETLEITEDDAAFIMGKGGKTKAKLMRVSQCEIDLLAGELVLEFTGTSQQRRRAMRYAKCVMAQRVGAVTINDQDVEEDCTVVAVPQEATGFVTGRGGNFLRTLEDEYGTLMFFADQDGVERHEEFVDLMIFGGRPGRRAAQLAVMSAIENKVPGNFSEEWRKTGATFESKADLVGDWGTSTTELSQPELSYAIGAHGKTRKKLGRASGCVVQYVGNVVFMSGTKREREQAKDYLKWLLDRLEGSMAIDTNRRDDVTVLEVPMDCVGYVTGRSRETLGLVEETFGTLMFFLGYKTEGHETEKLAIFGPLRARIGAKLMVMSAVERKTKGYFTHDLVDEKTKTKGFDTDRLTLDPEDMAYASGKEGSTRKKIAAASGAYLEFVGHMAFIAGDEKERRRCRDYLGWLLEQKDGELSTDISSRTDVTEVDISEEDIAWLLGSGLGEMRQIEQESHTFCCVMHGDDGMPRILICGHEEGTVHSETGRLKAERLFKNLMREHARGGGGGGGWGGERRERSRSRERWQGGGGGGGGEEEEGGRGQQGVQRRQGQGWDAG
mmetsp:Transcript_71435/g.231103  ORF Transcript_71435/g.231103 Transcript_71435/m.231103 type:complete len:571 (+) Transcript_71435:62-1774(+)